MSPDEFLQALRVRGFQIDAAGDRLLVSPASLLTDDDRQGIRVHIRALLALVVDDHEWIEERAGILEFDAGYDRTVAEVLAQDLLRTVREKARRAAA